MIRWPVPGRLQRNIEKSRMVCQISENYYRLILFIIVQGGN